MAVSFRPVGHQTLVELRHSGWEVFAEPAAARQEYDSSWPLVLARFGAHSSFCETGDAERPDS